MANYYKNSTEFNENIFFKAVITNNLNWLKTVDWTTANINVVDQFGWSGAMMAACEGSTKSFKFLLDNNADLQISDKKGRTALSLAEEKGYKVIADLITSKLNGNQAKCFSENIEKNNSEIIPFYCEVCRLNFSTETKIQHSTSILHRFRLKDLPKQSKRYGIPDSNVGFQLMLKQGWNRETGLGAKQEGPLYPVKTTIRKSRSGLGVKQNPARITHFSAFDRSAICWKPLPPKAKTRRMIERDIYRDRKKELKFRNELS